MNGLGQLKRCLQRRYGIVAKVIGIFALFTFFLEQSFVVQKRDLLFWRRFVVLLMRRPCLLFQLLITIFCLVLAGALLQQAIVQILDCTVTNVLERYRRRRFADFLVRRLLLQIELAMVDMPNKLSDQQLNDPQTRQRCQLAKDAAYKAVDIFRRDAAMLLFKRQNFSTEEAIFVLQEEEQMLTHGGYGRIGLRVDSQVLRSLLYPQSQN